MVVVAAFVGVSSVCVWANVCVSICHLHDRKIFLISEDKNKVLSDAQQAVQQQKTTSKQYTTWTLLTTSAIFPSHSIVTPDQPVLLLTL